MEYETLEAIIAWFCLAFAIVGFAIIDINWDYVFRKLRRFIYGRKRKVSR